MTGHELLRRLRRLARRRGVDLRYEPRHGKGSHSQLWLGDRQTVMKDPRKEIGQGAAARHAGGPRRRPGRAGLGGGGRCATPIRWTWSATRTAGRWPTSRTCRAHTPMAPMLYEALRAEGVSPAALAERLGVAEAAVRRLLDLDHRSHLDRIEAALRALGRRLEISVRSVA